MSRALLLFAIALTALGGIAIAQGNKPPVPAGRDPGGVAVALIATGIDYTLPGLAQRLARDGEGELIGWDLEDKDRQPFDRSKGATLREWGGDGTAVASFLSSADGVRLVPVRVNTADPTSLARAVAFVAQTPARVAVVAIADSRREASQPFGQTAGHFKDVLVIVPAGGSVPAYPTALGLDNVLGVEPGPASVEASGFGGRMQRLSGPPLAVAAAARAAAALLAREPRLDAATLKRRLVEIGGSETWQPRK